MAELLQAQSSFLRRRFKAAISRGNAAHSRRFASQGVGKPTQRLRQAAPAGKDEKPPVPTEDERNTLGRYTQAYINVWNDSFKRLLKRDKRDSSAITGIFAPVMQSIAELSAGAGEPVPDGIVTAALVALTKRAASWPAEVPSETVGAEFIKAVRSIHINTAKEVSAVHAAAEVASV